MENKYPENIMICIRQRFDMSGSDTSKDDIINEMTPDEVFEEVCEWHGLIGYDYTIKSWIRDIYNIDLDELSMDLEE